MRERKKEREIQTSRVAVGQSVISDLPTYYLPRNYSQLEHVCINRVWRIAAAGERERGKSKQAARKKAPLFLVDSLLSLFLC